MQSRKRQRKSEYGIQYEVETLLLPRSSVDSIREYCFGYGYIYTPSTVKATYT